MAARELMDANDVPINDLHKVVWADVDQFLSDDQLHLSEAGKQACARAVADSVSKLIPGLKEYQGKVDLGTDLDVMRKRG